MTAAPLLQMQNYIRDFGPDTIEASPPPPRECPGLNYIRDFGPDTIEASFTPSPRHVTHNYIRDFGPDTIEARGGFAFAQGGVPNYIRDFGPDTIEASTAGRATHGPQITFGTSVPTPLKHRDCSIGQDWFIITFGTSVPTPLKRLLAANGRDGQLQLHSGLRSRHH